MSPCAVCAVAPYPSTVQMGLLQLLFDSIQMRVVTCWIGVRVCYEYLVEGKLYNKNFL